MELNTREIALLIWLAIFVIAILVSKRIRPSALTVVRSLFQIKIVDVVGLSVLYTAGCVWLLAQADIWVWQNLKATITWYLGTAFIAMADIKKLERGPTTLLQVAKGAVAVPAVVLFIGSMNTLPLWAELLLVPTLTVIAAMVAIAEHKPEHRIVLGPLNAILIGTGLYILGYSIYRVITGWNAIDPFFQVREFAVPIALTLMFLPLLYGLMLYIGYENAAVRLQFKFEDRALRRYIWWRGILAFGAHVETFSRFIHAIQMADVKDRAGVRDVVGTLRRTRRREKNPPNVDWNEGWSPYAARDFLAEQNLRTNPYHPSVVDWCADAPILKLDDKLLADTLVYRIAGTETAATELFLELNVTTLGQSEEGDSRFWVIGCQLVLQALGDEAAELFARAVPTDDPLTIEAGRFTLAVERDAWGTEGRGGYSRQLTIRHPAYHDPISELE